ncbi:hypothetical protein HRJ34_17295 [Rhizorhabdus wittichii]|uniref:DUF4268 domain-containing protein n=1 Tax=Rhizorhabdus wittichii TaxID=160791 RepID=A0A975CYK7_9SPHN|nr:hypothetical protein [Rhizorhabdus wittichii]QTH20105.1 hypothetical protein HRJ34_17295 [Rhizorhabdus wittichii]
MTFILLDESRPGQVIDRQPQGTATQEHPLRDLIFEHPELLPVRELEPEIGRVVAVTRELHLPGAGFVDVFLISEHGRLILVECKLWRNPQARREVVGQILDYARELARYSYDDLQRVVSSRLERPGNALYELAKAAGSSLSEADFVDRVSRDLRHGRFLLLIAGDGITEGTQRIGEYLQAQAGLAFDFGLVEMAEYRFVDPVTGSERRIMQPRLLARTAVIERHVIRQEVPGVVIEPVEQAAPTPSGTTASAPSESFAAWRGFVDRFVAQVRFDDPGQLPPRSGGNGWIRVPLPDGLYVNLYRSASEQKIGAQVRFAGSEGIARWSELLAEREAIDAEFMATIGEAPTWADGDVPVLKITRSSPLPWNDAATEEEQRRWFAATANQFVNSLRPRLLGSGAA